MKINVEKLKNSSGSSQNISLSEVVVAKDYGYEDVSFTEALVFQGVIKNEKSLLTMTGHISGCMEVICGRCLSPFPYEVEADVLQQYTNQAEIVAADEEDEVHPFQGDELDITEDILRQIFLNLPMKFVCKDDCRGFCPHCGINLNIGSCSCADDQIDPRWEKLKILLDSNKKEV